MQLDLLGTLFEIDDRHARQPQVIGKVVLCEIRLFARRPDRFAQLFVKDFLIFFTYVSTAAQARPALAALFMGNEIGVPAQLAPQMNFEDVYLTADAAPDELELAANDAQYTTDYLHGLINSPEQRQAARQERTLIVGDVIDYNEKQYEVMGKLRGRDLQIMDKSTGNRFKATPGDGIYASLLNAKTEALKQQRTVTPEMTERDFDPEEEIDNTMEYEHADEIEHEEDNVISFNQEADETPVLDLHQEEGENQKSGRKR